MTTKNHGTLLLLILAFATFSCNKEDDKVEETNSENIERAAALKSFLEGNTLTLKTYYSDSAIDYVDTDQVVKAEKDLWRYVSLWIKDDYYIFHPNGEVTIQQNENRISSDTSAELTRNYSVVPDENGVNFNFLGHEYQPLQYQLVEFSDTLVRVYARWDGKTVVSEYKVIP